MPHIHEKIDFVVNAWIVYDGKILLIHHKKLNLWLSVGGHIELDENPDQALFREIKEECGLDVEIIAPKPKLLESGWVNWQPLYSPAYVDIHNFGETSAHRHIALNYFAMAKSDKFVHNKDEHNDIRWFTKEELGDPKFGIVPVVKFYANEAFKALEK
ncbi:MAG: NUDIX domain-containing protein [Patescibacteria group bacterium]|nr:NUDIX domain-containing protein [Patescibacteria group bacterium]